MKAEQVLPEEVDAESYMGMRKQMMSDESTTYWLKKAVAQMEQRDPVDALLDAEHLLKLMTRRMEEQRLRLYEEFCGILDARDDSEKTIQPKKELA